MTDEEIQEIICGQLGLKTFDEGAVGDAIDVIEISRKGLAFQMKTSMTLGSLKM